MEGDRPLTSIVLTNDPGMLDWTLGYLVKIIARER